MLYILIKFGIMLTYLVIVGMIITYCVMVFIFLKNQSDKDCFDSYTALVFSNV